MCGIVGIIGKNEVVGDVYESLIHLQHRGQESTGIATFGKQFCIRKGMGLVREVFNEQNVKDLIGNIGIGMVRYSTVGSSTLEEAHPFLTNSPYGIAFTYNGNVYNSRELKEELRVHDLRFINSDNDAEVILNVLASALAKVTNELTSGDLFAAICFAIESVYKRVKGGYSCVAILADKGLIAFRDPHGIRPLVWGRRNNGDSYDHIIASENTMFETLDCEFFRDISPGEVVFIDNQSKVYTRVLRREEFRPCVFEYVYLARSDAYLNGVSVHRARLRMGQNLGRKIKRLYPDLPVDIVIPAPTTANTAAMSCAHILGKRYSEAIIKNQSVGRTFIMPGENSRYKANKYKLSIINFEVHDKNVLVVDDSLVRGNVSRHIVKLLKKYGAKKVYFAVASPALRYPDFFGIDLPTRAEFIANGRSEAGVAELLGVDLLIYQDLKDLIEAVTRRGNLEFTKPHCAYFDGDYPTKDINEELLNKVELRRIEERQRICA